MACADLIKLHSCCRCCTLKTGTIVSGITGIVLAVLFLIIMFTSNIEFRTILINSLPTTVVKIILAINLVMTILISALLIIGAQKRNMYMLMPWVILGITLAFGLLISVIYTSVMFYIYNDSLNGTLWLIFGTISFIVFTYMWLVVYNFFLVVKDENDRGLYKKAPFMRHPSQSA